jgi:hypothetical protein
MQGIPRYCIKLNDLSYTGKENLIGKTKGVYTGNWNSRVRYYYRIAHHAYG